MQNPDGSIVADVPGICDSWVSFYSDLFSACPTNPDVQNQLLDNLSSLVPPSQVPLCEGHLTVEEAHKALLGMAKGKISRLGWPPGRILPGFLGYLGS